MDNIVIKDYEESDLESLNILLKEVYNLEKKKNRGINKEIVAKDNNLQEINLDVIKEIL